MKKPGLPSVVVMLLWGTGGIAQAQEADARPDREIVAEQYLLAGSATRGCGESQVAVNPIDPNQIAVAAMCIVHQNRGTFEQTEEEFVHTPRATNTQFVFTRDRGLTWTTIEDPMREYFGRYRCLDPFAAFTPDGTMIVGCEAHFPIVRSPEEEVNKTVHKTRQHFGGSALITSTDGGHTFGPPVEIISSYLPKEVLGPFVSFAPMGSQGDRPEIRIDASTGKVYVDGKSAAADPPHRQTVVRMSDDRGAGWGMVYAFDSSEWPQAGGSGYDVANGMMGVAYVASSVPASLNATCPCRVFGVSTDDGKTFARYLLPAPPPEPGGPWAFLGGMTVLANPTRKGMFTVLVASSSGADSYVTGDAGKTWTKASSVSGVPATRTTHLTAGYSPTGVMAVAWQAVYPAATPGSTRIGPPRGLEGWHQPWTFSDMPDRFEIWSVVSGDGGKTFSLPFKVSTAPSPGVSRRRAMRNLGRDYISAAVDDDFVHVTWYDDRAGFRGTWYGRVPVADFEHK
jgi:hypothetical protein